MTAQSNLQSDALLRPARVTTRLPVTRADKGPASISVTRPRFVCLAGRASDHPFFPPASGSLAHLFDPERVCRAIFGSPVVRADAAGLASRLGRTVRQTRLQQSGARIIRDTHPRLYRRRGQVCGNSFSFLNRAGVQPSQQSRRIAPMGIAASKGERVVAAARLLKWKISRAKDVWYADERVSLKPRELRKIEELSGVTYLEYVRQEVRTNDDLIDQASALLVGHEADFYSAFFTALRAMARPHHRPRTSERNVNQPTNIARQYGQGE